MQDYYYKVVIQPQREGGFTAYVPTLPGCVSEGETYQEAVDNITEAMELYLETMKLRKQRIKPENIRFSEICISL